MQAILHEVVTRRIIAGTVTIILGNTLTLYFSPHEVGSSGGGGFVELGEVFSFSPSSRMLYSFLFTAKVCGGEDPASTLCATCVERGNARCVKGAL